MARPPTEAEQTACFAIPPPPTDILHISEDIYLSEIDDPPIKSAVVKPDVFSKPPQRVNSDKPNDSKLFDRKKSRQYKIPSGRSKPKVEKIDKSKNKRNFKNHSRSAKPNNSKAKEPAKTNPKGSVKSNTAKPVKGISNQPIKRSIKDRFGTEEYVPKSLSNYRIPKLGRTQANSVHVNGKAKTDLRVQINNELASPTIQSAGVSGSEPSYEQLRAVFDKKKEKLRRKNKNRRERAKRDRNLLNHILTTEPVESFGQEPQ